MPLRSLFDDPDPDPEPLFPEALPDPLRDRDGNSRLHDQETSVIAAQDWRFPSRRSHRFAIGELYFVYPEGLTADEACHLSGIGGGWRRVSDLRRDGFLAPTGGVRNTQFGTPAEVLAMTDRSRAAWDAYREREKRGEK